MSEKKLHFNYKDIFLTPRIGLSPKKIWIFILGNLTGYIGYWVLSFLAMIISNKKRSSKLRSARGSNIPAKKDRFTIQVISKKRLVDAQKFADKLIKSGYDAYIQKAYFKETEEVWYRVRIGSYDHYNSAQAIANVVSKDIKLAVWVDFVRVDN